MSHLKFYSAIVFVVLPNVLVSLLVCRCLAGDSEPRRLAFLFENLGSNDYRRTDWIADFGDEVAVTRYHFRETHLTQEQLDTRRKDIDSRDHITWSDEPTHWEQPAVAGRWGWYATLDRHWPSGSVARTVVLPYCDFVLPLAVIPIAWLYIFARHWIRRICATWGPQAKPSRLFTMAAAVSALLFLMVSATWIQSEHGGFEGQRTYSAIYRFQSCKGYFIALVRSRAATAPMFAGPDFFQSPAGTLWSKGGFWRRSYQQKLGFWFWFESRSSFNLSFAYWLPTFLMLLVVSVWLLRRWAWSFRVRDGYCRECGYDLRGGHERCPECGVELGEMTRTKAA